MSSKITAKGIIAKVKDPVVAGKLTYKSITAQIEGFTKLEIFPVDSSKSFIDYNYTSSEIFFDAQVQRVSTRFTSEFISKEATKGIVNTKSTSSVFSRVVTYNRSFTEDSANATEDLQFAFTKGFLNPVDQIEIVEFNLLKPQLEQLNLSETFALNINPVYEDSLSALVDTVNLFIFKQFEEVVDATDDVFGEATIDDDQYAFVTKVLHNNISYNDDITIEMEYARDYEDQISNNDLVYFSAEVPLESFSSSTTDIIFDATKAIELQTVSSESIAKYISDYFAEDYSLEGYAGTLI